MGFSRISVWWLTGLGVLSAPLSVFSQGSLTPPGPPGPTMKTLAQIEPRTPIALIPFNITAAGSYYFTTNLFGLPGTNGIIIQADDVTVDLNGFSLIGGKASGKGIWVSGARRNVVIRNGTVRNWSLGVDAETAGHSRLEFLQVFDNGGHGIVAGPNNSVTSCTSYSNEGTGITADRESTIKDCFIRANIQNGIKVNAGSHVSGCTASFNSESGIVVEKDSLITNCRALNNSRTGFACADGTQITSSSASNNRETGINLGPNCVVTACFASINALSGIVAGDSSQVSGSQASFNGQSGILMGQEATVSNCTASHNQDNGIVAGASSQILEAKALGNKRAGIRVETGSTVRASTVQRNGGDGILVSSECTVASNNSNNNFNARDSAGIHATGTDNCIKENNVISNDRGLSVDVAGNMIIKNSASNNTINYFLIGSQTLGPIFKGTTPIDVTNPWTNFEF